ncbi:hypothetical protein L249_2392 [Ophiocordyceps polyrhachis-furcata BCC 54312]|uniref:G domain-containing protein n=1 Tax=Ophiocordyceps polyrhachis-furcata BCC 54312 TaxID=1330021 RepID=A0A367LPD5_9HYPO|nr:hypothetical protein L249_2392 [Ophiocordyceps polyrhachis-furcata BCC 54312]
MSARAWKAQSRNSPEHEHITHAEESARQSRHVPVTCSGCGAFSQTTDPGRLGYFDVQSRRVRFWLHRNGGYGGAGEEDGNVSCDDASQQGLEEDVALDSNKKKRRSSKFEADKLVQQVLSSSSLGDDKLTALGLTPATMLSIADTQALYLNQIDSDRPPVCERCHDLKHYGASKDSAKLTVPCPSIDILEDTMAESPHRNHVIYHVIDAADFPMSMIPQLHTMLDGVYMRTRNRRSETSKYRRGRSIKMCFVVTRADLLAPKKEMVDRMMPYFRQVIRDALGDTACYLRLDVVCVSPMASWWVDMFRERLWNYRGASWLFGRVNVGKSRLFHEILPKHRNDVPVRCQEWSEPWSQVDKLLPPLQPERDWPELPLASPHRGTTVLPIRVPYGTTRFGHKSELIDMPGLERGDLAEFVKEEYRDSLLMRKRIVPEQFSLKSKNALILGGGLIRIVPRTDDLDFLLYNFTPMPPHLTSAEKAAEFQSEQRQARTVQNWMMPGTGEKIQHAGTFKLTFDVTKKRAGPLTRRGAVGLRVEKLAFRVLSIDILIEGVGYVEVVAQVREKHVRRYPLLEPDKFGKSSSGSGSGVGYDMMASRVEQKLGLSPWVGPHMRGSSRPLVPQKLGSVPWIEPRFGSRPPVKSHITENKAGEELCPRPSAKSSWVTEIKSGRELSPLATSWTTEIDSEKQTEPGSSDKSWVTERRSDEDVGSERPPGLTPTSNELFQKMGLEPPPEPVPKPPPGPITPMEFRQEMGFDDPEIAEEVPPWEHNHLVDWPAIDVYSPGGRFIGSRRPIHGWENNKPSRLLKPATARPRQSMKGRKCKSLHRFKTKMRHRYQDFKNADHIRHEGRIMF